MKKNKMTSWTQYFSVILYSHSTFQWRFFNYNEKYLTKANYPTLQI